MASRHTRNRPYSRTALENTAGILYNTVGQNMKTETVKVELTADPLQFTMAERKNFKISIAATNQGDEVIDPELHRAKLFINGKESIVWMLAIGNGAREKKWLS